MQGIGGLGQFSILMATVVREQTPLLLHVGDEHIGGVLSETEEVENASEAARHDVPLCTSSRYILRLCVLTLVWDFAQYSVYAPLTVVFEEIICIHHYSTTFRRPLLPQRDCTVIPVQNELALLKGYKDAFSQIPSMLPRSLLPIVNYGEGNSMTW